MHGCIHVSRYLSCGWVLFCLFFLKKIENKSQLVWQNIFRKKLLFEFSKTKTKK